MSERTMYEPVVMLWDGKYQRMIAEASQRKSNAETRLRAAEGSNRRPLMVGDPDPLAALRKAAEEADKAFQDAVTEASEHGTTEMRGRTLGSGEWRALVRQHKPRPGDEDDEAAGWNLETFPEAVVRAALVEPTFPSDAHRDEWLDKKVTPGEIEQFYELVRNATLGWSVDPKDLSSGPSSVSAGE